MIADILPCPPTITYLGASKAEAAERHLRAISPTATISGISLSIPMPGHPPPPSDLPATRAAIAHLDHLVSSHDVVFLLTDTREARWLPTLLSTAHGKLAITAAVGFDTFLAMRHGHIPPEIILPPTWSPFPLVDPPQGGAGDSEALPNLDGLSLNEASTSAAAALE